MVAVMVTARQIRAGRALLGWTQQALADHAPVAVNSARAGERGLAYPKSDTVEAIRMALARAGIAFLGNSDMGEGVRLATPARKHAERHDDGGTRQAISRMVDWHLMLKIER